MVKVNDIRDFVYRWNHKFSIDRWWRKKYNIAFNSPQHREMSFIDMRIEYEEELLFQSLKKKDDEETYEPGTGNYLKPQKKNYSQKQIDDAFDKVEF